MLIRDIRETKNRFLTINRGRLQRMRMSLGQKKRDIFDLLPLLFHVNSPVLPGFVSRAAPRGISDYSPDRKALLAAKRLSKSFHYRRRALPNYDILGLYIIGSAGTIAYSDASDVDVWICFRPGLDETARFEELQRKAVLIEEWALHNDLKIHFFLMDVDRFVQGSTYPVTAEGSGSAQHMLLLEEFYRTGLLLAGRYPLWWLVPPDRDGDYRAITADLLRKRFLKPNECLDFGPLLSIPAGEFFGAALWQLNKAIECPYKAALKMFLMEAYAREYPETDMLSHRFKRSVYAGESDLNRLDPYRMMYDKLEAHLMAHSQQARLDLLRRCFYFKVDEPLLSADRFDQHNWRQQLLEELTACWHWPEEYIIDLKQRHFWKIDRVAHEYQELVRELTTTYRFLSQFARQPGQLTTIDSGDLNTLGRRLFAAFERKAGKVEIVNQGISSNVYENQLCIVQSIDEYGTESWGLYRGSIEDYQSPSPLCLRRAPTLIDLVAWCHFNRLLHGTTVLQSKVQMSGLTLRELRALRQSLQNYFPLPGTLHSSLENFKHPPAIRKSIIFANVGVDPMYLHSRDGRHLASSRTDALSYSGLHENLALTVDLLQITSWQEVVVYHYSGAEGVLDCLRDYLRSTPPAEKAQPSPLRVQCFSSSRGTAIARRLEELFNDVIHCYYGGNDHLHLRYLVEIDQSYFLLYFSNGVLQYKCLADPDDLVKELAREQSQYSPVIIDRHALRETPLPLIYGSNRQHRVQFYYYVDGEWIDVYVLDELGSLFFERIHSLHPDVLLSHFAAFLSAIIFRQQLQLGIDGGTATHEVTLEYYEIRKYASNDWRPVKRDPPRRPASLPGQIGLQVIGNRGTGEELSFTVSYNGKEISGIESGRDVFTEAARYILASRREKLAYPIHITDIDLPPSASTAGHNTCRTRVQTVHLLLAKKDIEGHLNAALASLQTESFSVKQQLAK